MAARVLVIDGDPSYRRWLAHHVSAVLKGADVQQAGLKTLDNAALDDDYQAVLVGCNLRKQSAELEWLRRLTARPEHPPVIVLGENGDELLAVAALHAGATDYIPKSKLTHELLSAALARAVKRREDALERTIRIHRGDAPFIPGYRVVKTVAASEVASVYLAISEKLRTPVVLKILERSPEPERQEALERFEREYEAASKIESRAIADVYDFGSTDEHAYIAMEWFPCGDLKARLAEPLLPRHCVHYLEQMAKALEAIHVANILHCDLKPANVMLREDNSLVLIDFGLAKMTDRGTRLTNAGEIRGSPYYMSPERATGQEVDRRSDIYSLGVIFFEMLTGAKPYSGATAMDVLSKHQHEQVPRLPKSLRHYQRLVDKLLAKEPAERYQSAIELLSASAQLDQTRQEPLAVSQRLSAV